MTQERDPSEGRVRRGRLLLAGAVAVSVLALLPVVSSTLRREMGSVPVPPTGPTGGLSEGALAGLRGRLVYLAEDAAGPGRQRIAVLDLVSGSVEPGPVVPASSAILPAGPRRDWLVLVGDDDGETVVRLLRGVTADARAVEIARGDFVSLSPSGRSLLVADAGAERTPGCPAPTYRLARVIVATGRTTATARGGHPCGVLTAVAMYGSRTPLVSLTRPGGLPGTYALHRRGPELLFGGSTSFGRKPQLFALGSGALVVWPDGDDLQLLPSDSLLVGGVLAWSTDGRHVVVDGRVGDRLGLWLVDVSEGDTHPLSLSGYAVVPGLADAAIDDAGTVFSAGPGGLLAITASSMFPLELPEGAPTPTRSLAWLP
jgi:hypothetical protein